MEGDNEDEEETGQKGISRERTFHSGKPFSEINAKLEEIAHRTCRLFCGFQINRACTFAFLTCSH